MTAAQLQSAVWLTAGVRTPFDRVGGALGSMDAIALSVAVARHMAAELNFGGPDVVVWGTTAPNVGCGNFAHEVLRKADIDSSMPAFTTAAGASSSMIGAIAAAGLMDGRSRNLALVGGGDSASQLQSEMNSSLLDLLRNYFRTRSAAGDAESFGVLPSDNPSRNSGGVRALYDNMRDFAEEEANILRVARADQDKFAHASHRRAIAASERGFFADLVIPVAGIAYDLNPRHDATLEKLSRLPPMREMESGQGTLTDGNSAPLTDGAAAIWVSTSEGLERLPMSLPRARLLDWASDAIDFKDGGVYPSAPVYGIPLLLARHGLKYRDIALWEMHEAFAGQVLAHIAALENPELWSSKMRVNWELGPFPCERVNPNGGSIALGDPFGATGARILSQAVKELAAMPHGSLAVVNIYAEGGQGTSVLLEHS